MGFWNKPFKATKAFCKNPVKIISNDLSNLDKGFNNVFGFNKQMTPQQAQCQYDCFNSHVNNTYNPADKKRIAKEVNDIVALSYCNKKCFK